MGEPITEATRASDTTVQTVASKNKLNEAELANPVLKETAVKVYLFLSGPTPDIESFRKSNGQLKPEVYAVLEKWRNEGSIAVRPFLKANGGKLHDEFRELWRIAFIDVNKSAVDAAKLWLQEQFELPAEPATEPAADIINPQGNEELKAENDEQSSNDISNRTEQNEPDEQSAATHAPLGASGGDSSTPVAELQEGEVADNRRNRRGHRKGTE